MFSTSEVQIWFRSRRVSKHAVRHIKEISDEQNYRSSPEQMNEKDCDLLRSLLIDWTTWMDGMMINYYRRFLKYLSVQ